MTRLTAPILITLTLLVAASPAGAQTAIFTEDAEGTVEAKWVVGTPPDGVEPWQKSDSATTKFRGNQAHGGSTSFWTGIQPANWPLVPTTAGPGTVIEGESIITLKEPFVVPADGETTVKYWSMFQNEGDDQGLLELAVVPEGGGKPAWKKLKAETATATAAGDVDPRACDPSRPETQQVTFEEQSASLGPYKGVKVLIRFNLKYGAENRPVSHPCGWYLDDIRVLTTGTPGKTGATQATPTTTTTTTPTAKPSVTFGKLKLKGKKATLGLTVSGAALKNVKAKLVKGSKTVGSVAVSELATGARSLVFKLKGKAKKGTYTIKLTATDFSKTGKVKGK
jgi:hypothetical protein